MPRSGRNAMSAEALTMVSRAGRVHLEIYQASSSGWEPPVDVLEVESGLLVVVALPGVRRADMDVVIGSGELLVRGTRRWPIAERPAKVHRLELPHGRFERRLPLPPGAFQLLGEEYTDGCLLLTLRRLA
jgi:HSP20 family protein